MLLAGQGLPNMGLRVPAAAWLGISSCSLCPEPAQVVRALLGGCLEGSSGYRQARNDLFLL